MNAGTGLRTMLRALGADEHHNRNERLAQSLYEAANSELLYATAAAWVRWDDASEDCRASWLAFVERNAS